VFVIFELENSLQNIYLSSKGSEIKSLGVTHEKFQILKVVAAYMPNMKLGLPQYE